MTLGNEQFSETFNNNNDKLMIVWTRCWTNCQVASDFKLHEGHVTSQMYRKYCIVCRDHFVNVPNQWEMTLHCNVICHWQGAYTKWSLGLIQFLAATKQLYKWYFPSVRPSVCLSHLFDYVPIIVSSWNFQELLPMTKVRSMQKVKVRGQRSRSQRSQPIFTISGL